MALLVVTHGSTYEIIFYVDFQHPYNNIIITY